MRRISGIAAGAASLALGRDAGSRGREPSRADSRRCGDRQPVSRTVRRGAAGPGGRAVPAGWATCRRGICRGSREQRCDLGAPRAPHRRREHRRVSAGGEPRSGHETELEEFLRGVDELRETADRIEARLERLERRAEGCRLMRPRVLPGCCRSSARWSGTGSMISCAPPICTGRFAFCATSRRGPGFSAASASRAASGCAWRSRSWDRSSSNSARHCRRAATCCRRTSPMNWRNCRTACRRSPARSRSRSIEKTFGQPAGRYLRQLRTHAAGRRLHCAGACGHAQERRARSSSRCCARACARSSILTSRCWMRWPSSPTNIGRRRAGCARSRWCASTARPSSMNSTCCARRAMPRS